MGIDGAIIQAIKSLEAAHKAGFSCGKSLQSLKGLLDESPEHLEDAMKSFDAFEDITPDDYCKKYNSTPHYAQWKAAKLLQEAVKCQNTK